MVVPLLFRFTNLRARVIEEPPILNSSVQLMIPFLIHRCLQIFRKVHSHKELRHRFGQNAWNFVSIFYRILPPAWQYGSTNLRAGLFLFSRGCRSELPRPLSQLWRSCLSLDSSRGFVYGNVLPTLINRIYSTNFPMRWCCSPWYRLSPIYIAGLFRTASRPSSYMNITCTVFFWDFSFYLHSYFFGRKPSKMGLIKRWFLLF